MNAKSRLELLAKRKAEAKQKTAAAKPLKETERALRACANEDLAHEMQPWQTEPLENSVEWAERMDWKAYSKRWIKERVVPALSLLAKLMEQRIWAYDDLAAGVDDDSLEQRRECKQWMREAVRPLVCVKAKAPVVTGVGRDVGDMLGGDHGCWKFYHEFFGELAAGLFRSSSGPAPSEEARLPVGERGQPSAAAAKGDAAPAVRPGAPKSVRTFGEAGEYLASLSVMKNHLKCTRELLWLRVEKDLGPPVSMVFRGRKRWPVKRFLMLIEAHLEDGDFANTPSRLHVTREFRRALFPPP